MSLRQSWPTKQSESSLHVVGKQADHDKTDQEKISAQQKNLMHANMLTSPLTFLLSFY